MKDEANAARPAARSSPPPVRGSEPIIRLFHVGKMWPGDPPALCDVSLDVAKGELLFLTGASGAGKSTLLKLVFGQEAPTHGQVIVGGRSVSRLNRDGIARLRRGIGVVFQDFKLLPTRTVFDNVAVTLEVRGDPPEAIRRRVTSLLRQVGLPDKAESLPARLSGGEQQRVALARALAGDPAILLADEPTGNLDPERSEEIMEMFGAAHARGTTVIVATHDRHLLARHARRVLVLEKGRVVGDGLLDRAAASSA